MQYVDMNYYYGVYRGNIEAATLDRQLQKASREVNALCFGRIGQTIEELSDYEKEIIQGVVCEVADFNYENADALKAINSSYTIGDVSITNFDTNSTIVNENGYYVPSEIIAELDSTRLRNKLI